LEVVPHGFPNADMLSQLACIIFNLLKISQLDPQVWPCQAVVSCSTGVIWHPIHFETPVIPAKAGIHFSSFWKRAEGKLDSRFRGNDCAFERPGLANDTSSGHLLLDSNHQAGSTQGAPSKGRLGGTNEESSSEVFPEDNAEKEFLVGFDLDRKVNAACREDILDALGFLQFCGKINAGHFLAFKVLDAHPRHSCNSVVG